MKTNCAVDNATLEKAPCGHSGHTGIEYCYIVVCPKCQENYGAVSYPQLMPPIRNKKKVDDLGWD